MKKPKFLRKTKSYNIIGLEQYIVLLSIFMLLLFSVYSAFQTPPEPIPTSLEGVMSLPLFFLGLWFLVGVSGAINKGIAYGKWFIALMAIVLALLFPFAKMVQSKEMLEFVNQVMENPEKSTAIALTLAGFFLLLKFSEMIVNLFNWRTEQPEFAKLNIKSSHLGLARKPYTVEERKDIATHETGHLICCLGLSVMPKKLTATVYDSGLCRNGENVGGIVWHSLGTDSDDLVSPDDNRLWDFKMLFFTAGHIAETLFSEHTIKGTASDKTRWEEIAIARFRTFDGGMYYMNPKNDLELNFNNQRIQNLLSEHTTIVAEFLQMNKAVFLELRDLLFEKGHLENADLTPFFDRIKRHDKFPNI